MADGVIPFDEVIDDVGGGSNAPMGVIPFDLVEEDVPVSFVDSVIDGAVSLPRNTIGAIASIPSGISNIYNTIRHPVDSVYDGTAEKTARGAGTMASAIAGGGTGAMFGGPIGAVVGASAGLLGFDWLNQLTGSDNPTTPEEDKRRLGENMGAGLGAEIGIRSIGRAAKAVKNNTPSFASNLDRRSIGMRQSDYGKSSDLRVTTSTAGDLETIPKQKIDQLLKNDELGRSRNPAEMLENLKVRSESLMTSIDDTIRAYDQQGVPAKVDFSNAIKYLDEGKVPANQVEAYLNRLAELDSGIVANGGGKLTYIQQQKIAHGRLWDPADSTANGFNRAIYKDLQNAVEKYAPGTKALNNELSKFQVAEPILNRALKQAEATDLGTQVRGIAYTTTGVGAPTLLGGSVGGPVGAALGFGAGLGLKWLGTPNGQAALARGLRSAGNVASKVSKITDAAAPFAAGVGASAARESDGFESYVARQSPRSSSESVPSDPLSAPTILAATRSETRNTQPRQERGVIDSLFNRTSSPTTTPENSNSIINTLFSQGNMGRPIKEVEAEIDADPYLKAVYQVESSRNPTAKNPKSSAQGGFQLIRSTAKALGVEDPNDLDQALVGMKKLTDEHRARFGDNPELLYSAHFLGATLLSKVLKGAPLKREEQKHVDELRTIALPRFRKAYESVNV